MYYHLIIMVINEVKIGEFILLIPVCIEFVKYVDKCNIKRFIIPNYQIHLSESVLFSHLHRYDNPSFVTSKLNSTSTVFGNENANSQYGDLSWNFERSVVKLVAKVTSHHPCCQSRQKTQQDGSTRCCVVHTFLLLLAATARCYGHLASVIRRGLTRDCCSLGTTVALVWQKPQPF